MLDRVEVRRRVTELAAAVVAVHDDALDAVRSLQRSGRLRDVALQDALTHVGRRPGDLTGVAVLDHGADLERQRSHHEVICGAKLLQQRDVPGGPVPEPEALADDHRRSVQAAHQDPLDELRRSP